MNIIRWKCGCIQIQDEPIFLAYCEGDSYSDWRLMEYIFDYNEDRECIAPFELITDPEAKKHMLMSITSQSRDAYHYRRFKRVLKDMVK